MFFYSFFFLLLYQIRIVNSIILAGTTDMLVTSCEDQPSASFQDEMLPCLYWFERKRRKRRAVEFQLIVLQFQLSPASQNRLSEA